MAQRPSDIINEEVNKAANFVNLASVILEGTNEAKVFGLLLDRYRACPEGLTVKEIQDEIMLPQPVVSASLLKLEKKGIIGSRPEGQSRYKYLTDEAYKAAIAFRAEQLAF